MTTEEINAMMADFLGLEKTQDGKEWHCRFGNVNQYMGVTFLRFHDSWDWLVPVARKVHEELGRISAVGQEDLENLSPVVDDIEDVHRTVAIHIHNNFAKEV